METFNAGDLVFAKVTSRGPPWPAVVTKCLANHLYQVRCFGTDTVADVKATAIVTYSTYSLARFDSNKNRKIKLFVLALDLIREKREDCGCNSGCSIPMEERKKVKLTVCEEGENEILDIAKLKVVKKGKTPNKRDKTPNKKRKAESVSDEKEVVNGRCIEKEVVVNGRGILSNRIASKIISPVPKRRRTVNFAPSPSSEVSSENDTSTPLPLSGVSSENDTSTPLPLSEVFSENDTSTPLPLSGFSQGKSDGEATSSEHTRRQINFQSDNITDVASSIVEELNETRETIKKIMDMNQSKELTIHYLSLLMNEKKLIDNDHDKNKKLINSEHDQDKTLINSEHDNVKQGYELAKMPGVTESNSEPILSEVPDSLNLESDDGLYEVRKRIIFKKKITFKSAKCLYNDEIDANQDLSDYNNCHQLAEDGDEHQSDISKTIDITKVPLEQTEDSSNFVDPTTIINPTILAEMVQAKDESCASSLLLSNISRCLDVNSNKDCEKSAQSNTLPCDLAFDALAKQAKRETIDIVTSTVHLTNVMTELTAKTVDCYEKGNMAEDEEKPSVDDVKPVVGEEKPIVDDIMQKSLDSSNSSEEVSSDDFSDSEENM